MHEARPERFETAIVAAGPMWGLLEDRAVIVVDISSEPALAVALEESSEASSSLAGEWVTMRERAGVVALRIDLGLERDCGLDLTLDIADPSRAEDLEALAAYDLVEIWVDDSGDLTRTFRVRPRGSEIFQTIFEGRGALA